MNIIDDDDHDTRTRREMHRGRGVDASTGMHIKVDGLDSTMPTRPTIEGMPLGTHHRMHIDRT